MRLNFRYGVAVGIVVAALSTLGPVAAQAGQTHGTSVPASAGAVSVQAPPAQLPGIAQRANNTAALGLPGQQDRTVATSDRCDQWGSWRYSDCRYPDHHNCWWRWGWYDHYHHWHSGWHRYCRYYDHYDHYDHYNHYGM